jgi:CelD/BcsL family acetyltransferase involved in cellulose biosynthesis
VPTIDLLAPADASALLAERPEWTSSVFTTPVWWNNALHMLTQGCEVRLAAITEGDRTIGVLGVTIDRERGLARLVGDPISDHIGPLHDESDRAAVAARLPGLLDALLPTDLPFRTDGLHPDFRHADPRATVLDVPCPLVRLDRSWAEYLAQPGARRRRRIAALGNRLLQRDDVEIIDHTTPAQVRDALGVLGRLHELRFDSGNQLFRGRSGEFVASTLPALAAHGGASIRVLHVGDEPAAAILLLRHGATVSFYQSGWDPRFAELSVGRTLLADTIRTWFDRAASVGDVQIFDLLRGDEPYKSYWADDQATVLELGRPAADGRRLPDEVVAP